MILVAFSLVFKFLLVNINLTHGEIKADFFYSVCAPFLEYGYEAYSNCKSAMKKAQDQDPFKKLKNCLACQINRPQKPLRRESLKIDDKETLRTLKRRIARSCFKGSESYMDQFIQSNEDSGIFEGRYASYFTVENDQNSVWISCTKPFTSGAIKLAHRGWKLNKNQEGQVTGIENLVHLIPKGPAARSHFQEEIGKIEQISKLTDGQFGEIVKVDRQKRGFWSKQQSGNMSKVAIPEKKIARFVLQLAEQVEALHKKNIAHGDLKQENVLVSDQYTPVPTDFGSAFIPPHNTRQPMYSTPGYIPAKDYPNVINFAPRSFITAKRFDNYAMAAITFDTYYPGYCTLSARGNSTPQMHSAIIKRENCMITELKSSGGCLATPLLKGLEQTGTSSEITTDLKSCLVSSGR